jgi:hypothetical protein
VGGSNADLMSHVSEALALSSEQKGIGIYLFVGWRLSAVIASRFF